MTNQIITDETKKGIENHKTLATHLTESAKHHNDAAMHHENGNVDKAKTSALKADEHHKLATELQGKIK